MALNLDKLRKMYQFRFGTEGLGKLLCHNLSVSAMSDAGKWLENRGDKSSEEFTRYISTILCQSVANDEDDSEDRISQDQAKLLTQNDIQEFSKLFFEKNKYILEDREKREIIHKKDNDGKVVVSFKDHFSEELLKREGESDTDHFLRVIEEYIKQSAKQNKKLFKSFTKNLFSNSTLNLIDENKRISDSLGNTLLHHKPFKLPERPENPVHETNRNLASFGKELNEVAYLIKNMNDLGVKMAIDTATASARSKHWNNIMFALGLVTLIVTAIFSYMSFSSSNLSSTQVERLLNEQIIILQEQVGKQKNIVDMLSVLLSLAGENISQSKKVGERLDQISGQLKNITNQSSSQPSAARTPRSGASD